MSPTRRRDTHTVVLVATLTLMLNVVGPAAAAWGETGGAGPSDETIRIVGEPDTPWGRTGFRLPGWLHVLADRVHATARIRLTVRQGARPAEARRARYSSAATGGESTTDLPHPRE